MAVEYKGFGLTDQVAIVTGPSQSIGRAIAVGLAKAGAHVALAPRPSHDRNAIAGLTQEIEALFRVLSRNDIQAWADRFLAALERQPARASPLQDMASIGIQ